MDNKLYVGNLSYATRDEDLQVTVVSAMKTVWLWPTMTWMPNGVRPGAGSITRFTSRIECAQVRVMPVIIASASPTRMRSAAMDTAVMPAARRS